jgi:hypothetical protein
MKKIMLAAVAAVGVTIGVASLANAAAALIKGSGHSGRHTNILSGWYVDGGNGG